MLRSPVCLPSAITAILPDVRAFRALLCASLGREAEARSELEALAADGCAALPRNLAWV